MNLHYATLEEKNATLEERDNEEFIYVTHQND